MNVGATTTSSGSATLAVAALAALLGLAALAWQLPRRRGTTLVAPWVWSLISLVTQAACEIVIGSLADAPAPNWACSARFAAAMGTFCPIMAMLGAKRPQNRAWQFIVLSLWGILSLPSAEWLLFGGVQEIHSARFWFLIILIVVGALNGLATRAWLGSLLYCGGQVVLLAPFFPATQSWLAADQAPAAGLVLLAAAWCLEASQRPRTAEGGTRLDRVWLDFRDAFGVVWSLRIAERVNASATMYDWPVQLDWQGFVPRQPHAEPLRMPAAVEDNLRTLLRRFVSPEWIDARIEPVASDHTTVGSA